jgi:hypothetical protein
MLWKTPEQTGFHAVRAEVFPGQARRDIAGISRVISLPVSSKASATSFFSEKYRDIFTGDNPALIHWYQFRGALQDSKNPISTERALIPVDGKIPKWLPYDNSYGLSTGTDEAYLTPPFSFYREGAEEGGAQILARFRPVSGGPVLSVSFGSKFSPEENAALAELILKDGKTVLRLSAPAGAAEEIALPVYASPDYHVTVLVGFYISEKRLDAKIRFESGSDFLPEFGSVDLTVPPGGEARIRLGTPAGGGTGSAPDAENTGAFTESGSSPGQGARDRGSPEGTESGGVYSGDGGSAAVRIMWDELAIFRSSMPVIEEETERPSSEEAYPGSIPAAEEAAAASGRESGEQTPLGANPDISGPGYTGSPKENFPALQ